MELIGKVTEIIYFNDKNSYLFAKVVKILKQSISHAHKIEVECDTLAQVDEAVNCGADIIGLQEIRGEGPREDYVDQIKILSEKTGLYYYFAEAIKVEGANPYGNAILSRYPIINAETIAIPDPEIKLYDDVTSGPEDEEPSEEEKEAKRLSGEETETMTREIQEEIEGAGEGKSKIIEYTYPDIDLLAKPQMSGINSNVQEELMTNARQLIETLRSFKVDAKVVEISQGPTITRYEIEPAEGVRVSQITGLSKDIGLKFKAEKGVMVAPVPGKSTIGIEIENKDPSVVTLREVIESDEFKNHKSKLAVALGKDVSGKPIVMDLAKMPHLLIAGA